MSAGWLLLVLMGWGESALVAGGHCVVVLFVGVLARCWAGSVLSVLSLWGALWWAGSLLAGRWSALCPAGCVLPVFDF